MILCYHVNIPLICIFSRINDKIYLLYIMKMFLTPKISCLFSFLNCITLWKNIQNVPALNMYILQKENMWKLFSYLNCHIFHRGWKFYKNNWILVFNIYTNQKSRNKMKMWIFLICSHFPSHCHIWITLDSVFEISSGNHFDKVLIGVNLYIVHLNAKDKTQIM